MKTKTSENNSSGKINELFQLTTDFEINGIDNGKPVDEGRERKEVNEVTMATKDDDSSNEESSTESSDSEVDKSGESELEEVIWVEEAYTEDQEQVEEGLEEMELLGMV